MKITYEYKVTYVGISVDMALDLSVMVILNVLKLENAHTGVDINDA